MLITLPVDEDYTLINNMAMVNVSAVDNDTGCISITITDDDVPENSEFIIIRLEANVTQLSTDVANGLSIDTAGLNINIEDNDGMCVHVSVKYLYTNVVLFLGFVTIKLAILIENISIEEAEDSLDVCIQSIVFGQPALPPDVDSLDLIFTIGGNATGIAIIHNYMYL